MIKEEIILKFFEGKCDAEDAAIVHAWLTENPAKLKEYLGAEEWEEFQPDQALSPDVSRKLWAGIHTNTQSTRVRYLNFRRLAAAAILLVIGLSWQFLIKQKTTATAAVTKDVFNNTLSKMTLTLSDGSTVELSPNSTLSYPETFSGPKRDVTLNGEANFNIAKDVARPFSVFSNSVLISVLGTRFTVSSYEANNATKIILQEGRVRIKTPHSSSQDNKNEYNLTPGDIFIFKKANAPSRILHLEKDKNDCYAFSNYPLDVVFDQLEIIYHTKIVYNKAALGNRSFIGKIDKKDSLYNTLKSIALLNHFSLHKQGDSLIISN